MALELIRQARPGDRIDMLVFAGIGRNGPEFKVGRGRAVMCFPDRIVVNMGGKYGRPAVANEANIVAVRGARKAA